MSSQAPRCGRCRHFHNDPQRLEHSTPGLSSLGSAWAAVRADDGLCELWQRYLAAHSRCQRFEPA